jgi:hypothetical protein
VKLPQRVAKTAEASLVGMIGIPPCPRGEKPTFTQADRLGAVAPALCINGKLCGRLCPPTHCVEIIAFIAAAVQLTARPLPPLDPLRPGFAPCPVVN